ncbi:MAG TPA: DUF503 domain-containing protein [Thermoanaerobacterales bacterium]|uniref:DUF503 domain-containing protein n=1 Tax=Tepidanaerobacter sp. GT38 TaxID=2722793 RepID=UPI00183FEEDE|nr:DUF503 domain-containing protein [Tepidanaerobacter sp. GT38]MCG1012256.1 DUF503 domain-containing protein [Tepidanaerobacter sp. GT38]HHY42857.1 DUF503 domain-containing protein [Thermoanaerobacterales bacterium]
MVVGILTVELSLGDIFSLKEKRQIIKSVIDRIKNRYNVSIAEVDKQDLKRQATIGIACVSNSSKLVDRQLDLILDFLESDGRFAIEDIYKEIL